jgi:hypothetical protein
MNYSDKDYGAALPAGAEVLIGNTTLKTADVFVWKMARQARGLAAEFAKRGAGLRRRGVAPGLARDPGHY